MESRKTFEARAVQSTGKLIDSIDNKDIHPELKAALKEAALENHNATIEMIKSGKFDWAIKKESKA